LRWPGGTDGFSGRHARELGDIRSEGRHRFCARHIRLYKVLVDDVPRSAKVSSIDIDADCTYHVTIGVTYPRGRRKELASFLSAGLASQIVPREPVDHPRHQFRVGHGSADLPVGQRTADPYDRMSRLAKVVDDDFAIVADGRDRGCRHATQ